MRTWRGRVSEVRPSPGPRPPPPEWKGMGPPRCQCRTSFHPHTTTTTITARLSSSTTHPLSVTRHLLLLFFFCTLAWTSVTGFSLQKGSHSQCQIDQCFEQYNSAKEALELSSSSGVDHPLGGGGGSARLGEAGRDRESTEALCTALRTYWSCIQGTKNSSRGCQGDIRYYSVRNGVKNQMQQYNCTLNGPTVDPSQQLPPPPRQVPPQCRFHGREVFRHCGLFGDPHLRTFTKEFQTCKVKGAWPLVNNKYLIVQVTNDPVLGGAGDATATSKLTVIVKGHPECGSDHYHTYQAQTDELPGAFEDGNTAYGQYSGVQLTEIEPNGHVEIQIHYIATTIIIRQIGRYFTFAIHMPEELVHLGQDSQEPELCSKGCPASERIDYKRYLAQKRDRVSRIHSQATGSIVTVTRYEAENLCRDSGLVDFYFDSCVFDVMATGDSNFTVAALSALQDVVRLDPSMAHVANRTSLQIYDDLFGAASALTRTLTLWWYMTCVLSVCLTLLQSGWMPVR